MAFVPQVRNEYAEAIEPESGEDPDKIPKSFYHRREYVFGVFNRKKIAWASIHPGEILLEDYMKPEGISTNRIARDLRVPVTRISEIVNQRRAITGDTALRLGRYFSNSAEFWMNLQRNYDLRLARAQFEKQVELDVRPRTAA
jgi:addiction module HigA family antidote